jgi:ABC-2 type transport system permease protein
MRKTSILVIGRGLKSLAVNPFSLLSGLGMSLFFLIVYDAGIGGIGVLPEFGGAGYLAFLLPMGVISLIFGSSSGSAQALNRDIQSGYFKRLALAPVPRSAFVLAAIFADAVGVLLCSTVILLVALLLGVEYRNGFAGAAGVIALTVLFGSGISALSAAVVMRTGKSSLAATVGSVVFSLLFLAPTFVPRGLMGARWLEVVSWGNPLTYLMEAMRRLISGTGDTWYIPAAFAIAVGSGLGGSLLAVRSTRNVLN